MQAERVRMAHREGIRECECIERNGDWAITRNDVGLLVLTHLPTGIAIRNSGHDYRVSELTWLLDQLAELPRMDLQSLDFEAIRKVVNP